MKKYPIRILYANTNFNPNSTLIFNNLCNSRDSTLLLEYTDIHKQSNIESFLIIDSALRIIAMGNTVLIQALTNNGAMLLPLLDNMLPKKVKVTHITFNSRTILFPRITTCTDEDNRINKLTIFDCLRCLTKLVKIPSSDEKAMFFGGLFSYDLITVFESITILNRTKNCPYYCFYLAETLLTINNAKKKCLLQCSIFNNTPSEEHRLKRRLEELKCKMTKKSPKISSKPENLMKLKCNMNEKEYLNLVKNIKKNITRGEVFQVVPSKRFYLPCPSPLEAYKILKNDNVSPYMFFMQDELFTLFGTSPETALKYNEQTREITMYPIAGSRERGYLNNGNLNRDLDNRIELEMRTNPKELSEHLMLVDLARNDLAHICDPGSRYVTTLTKVDKYTFIMHLVSKVIGKLRNDLDMLHAYCACMNMGTVSGAPKIKAMQLIYELEKENRGSYGGTIGYFTGNGDLHTCIVIRSAYIENNIATIQAGSGIVLDSIPELESNEIDNKARAVLNSIMKAHSVSEFVNG